MEKLFGLSVCSQDYEKILAYIENNINANIKGRITYINFYGVNKFLNDNKLLKIFNSFDLVHPDGIGVVIAAKILYGKDGIKNRMTGSDFYPQLMRAAEQKKWKIFLFGEKEDVLKDIKAKYSNINFIGFSSGYNFNTSEVIDKINDSSPDILLVGMGCPKQEKWIYDNYNKFNAKITIAVGAGLKILSKSSIRGPKIIQTLGFEWVIKLLSDPKRFWKRYLLGIPHFLLTVLYFKTRQIFKHGKIK